MKKRHYDLIFIISLLKDIDEVKSDIDYLLKSYDVEVLENRLKDKMGVRQLAYKIKKQDRAYYYILSLKMYPKDNIKFGKEIGVNENILRYMSFFRDVEKLEKLMKKREKEIEKKRIREELKEKLRLEKLSKEEEMMEKS